MPVMTAGEAADRLENQRSGAELGGRFSRELSSNQSLTPGTALALQYYDFGNS